MVEETIVQHWILTQFILPFLLVWFIAFALLEKTKIFGDDKKQLNALTAAVLGAIFVGAVFPKMMVTNLILFFTVAIVVVFVGLLLWGFVSGGEFGKDFLSHTGLKWTAGVLVLVSVILAVVWAGGVDTLGVFDLIFRQSWSQNFWTNVAFIVVVAAAIAWAYKGSKPE